MAIYADPGKDDELGQTANKSQVVLELRKTRVRVP